MTTTTTTRCDFCNAAQVPSEKDRWDRLETKKLDCCPVCIAKMRGEFKVKWDPSGIKLPKMRGANYVSDFKGQSPYVQAARP